MVPPSLLEIPAWIPLLAFQGLQMRLAKPQRRRRYLRWPLGSQIMKSHLQAPTATHLTGQEPGLLPTLVDPSLAARLDRLQPSLDSSELASPSLAVALALLAGPFQDPSALLVAAAERSATGLASWVPSSAPPAWRISQSPAFAAASASLHTAFQVPSPSLLVPSPPAKQRSQETQLLTSQKPLALLLQSPLGQQLLPWQVLLPGHLAEYHLQSLMEPAGPQVLPSQMVAPFSRGSATNVEC